MDPEVVVCQLGIKNSLDDVYQIMLAHLVCVCVTFGQCEGL